MTWPCNDTIWHVLSITPWVIGDSSNFMFNFRFVILSPMGNLDQRKHLKHKQHLSLLHYYEHTYSHLNPRHIIRLFMHFNLGMIIIKIIKDHYLLSNNNNNNNNNDEEFPFAVTTSWDRVMFSHVVIWVSDYKSKVCFGTETVQLSFALWLPVCLLLLFVIIVFLLQITMILKS